MKRALIAIGLVVFVATPATASHTREHKVQTWINGYRFDHDREMLTRSWPLDNIAEDHSKRMANNHRLIAYKGSLDYVISAARPGHLWEDAFRGWVKSKWRGILLNREHSRFGIGVVRGGRFLWVTVVFNG